MLSIPTIVPGDIVFTAICGSVVKDPRPGKGGVLKRLAERPPEANNATARSGSSEGNVPLAELARRLLH